MIAALKSALQYALDAVMTAVIFIVIIAVLALGGLAMIFGPIIAGIVLLVVVIWFGIQEFRNR